MSTRSEKRSGEWAPEPCQLRDGETADLSTHARRNLEQIRQGVEDGILDPSDLSSEQRARLAVVE